MLCIMEEMEGSTNTVLISILEIQSIEPEERTITFKSLFKEGLSQGGLQYFQVFENEEDISIIVGS